MSEFVPESTKSTGWPTPVPANQSTPEVTRALKPCPFCGGPAKVISCMGEYVGAGLGHNGSSYGPDRRRVVCQSLYEDPVRECPGRTIADAASAIMDWNTRTPARGGDELREALEQIAINSNRDWDQVRKNPAKQIDVIHTLAVDALYGTALASTDMAGAGEKTREALIATKAMYEVEIALLRNTLIAMGRMIPGVALHDDVSSSFLALLPTELASVLAAPPVEGLTSGEGWNRDAIAEIIAANVSGPNIARGHADAALHREDQLTAADRIMALAASPKATATASVREGRMFSTFELGRQDYLRGEPRGPDGGVGDDRVAGWDAAARDSLAKAAGGLRRINAGRYESEDGMWSIVQTDRARWSVLHGLAIGLRSQAEIAVFPTFAEAMECIRTDARALTDSGTAATIRGERA